MAQPTHDIYAAELFHLANKLEKEAAKIPAEQQRHSMLFEAERLKDYAEIKQWEHRTQHIDPMMTLEERIACCEANSLECAHIAEQSSDLAKRQCFNNYATTLRETADELRAALKHR